MVCGCQKQRLLCAVLTVTVVLTPLTVLQWPAWTDPRDTWMSTASATPITNETVSSGNDDAIPANASLIWADSFDIWKGVDFNPGPVFDVGLPSHRDARDDHETVDHFIGRCARRCIELNAAATMSPLNRCSGFVVAHQGSMCYVKRFLPLHRAFKDTSTSYILKTHPSQRRNADVADYRRRIAMGCLSTAKYIHSRLIPALDSWLASVDAVFLFETPSTDVSAVVNDTVAVANVMHTYGMRPLTTEDSNVHALLLSIDTTRRHFWGRKQRRAADTDINTSVSRMTTTPSTVLRYATFAASPRDPHVRSFNGAWKNFPLLRRMHTAFGLRKDWFLMVDDDSFVVHHNMAWLIHGVYQHLYPPLTRAAMIGALFKVGGGGNSGSALFVQGGAGILMTRVAVQMMAASLAAEEESAEGGPPPPPSSLSMDEVNNATTTTKHRQLIFKKTREGVLVGGTGAAPLCMAWCQQWAGDIRLSCCGRLHRIRLQHDFTFWSEDPSVSVTSAHRQDIALFPSTFHQVKTEELIRHTFDVVSQQTAIASAAGGPLNWTAFVAAFGDGE